MYEKILVPLDGSQRAEAILPHVEELALRFEAKVIFVQVVEPAPLVTAAESAYMSLRRADFERRTKEAKSYLAVQQGKFRSLGIEVESRVVFGPVVEAVIKVAGQVGADLIALASHGRSGLSRVFYGSVAAGLLQRVSRPLLLVRARDGQ